MSYKSSLNFVDMILTKLIKLSRKSGNLLLKPSLIGTYLLTFCFYTGLSSRWLTQQGDAAGYVDALSASGNYKVNFSYGLSFNRGMELFQKNPVQ